MRTHGLSDTNEHQTWRSMKKRCGSPGYKNYSIYGGRGIKICDRWLNSFENFYADMGTKPSPKHSIDRIDSNGDYEPSNCRWATDTEQARNQGLRKDNSSGFKGVGFCNASGRYKARISAEGKRISLGSFDTLIDAVAARLRGERLYWGTR